MNKITQNVTTQFRNALRISDSWSLGVLMTKSPPLTNRTILLDNINSEFDIGSMKLSCKNIIVTSKCSPSFARNLCFPHILCNSLFMDGHPLGKTQFSRMVANYNMMPKHVYWSGQSTSADHCWKRPNCCDETYGILHNHTKCADHDELVRNNMLRDMHVHDVLMNAPDDQRYREIHEKSGNVCQNLHQLEMDEIVAFALEHSVPYDTNTHQRDINKSYD